jgi:hypothetical protein
MEDLEVICDDTLIGCKLMKMGIMNQKQVDVVAEKQNKGDSRLFGEIAIELGFIDEAALMKYLEFNN